MSRFRRRGGKDKFNVNNALICEFHFDSDNINVCMGQGIKTLRRSVVPTFENMSKPVAESDRKPHAARKTFSYGNISQNKGMFKSTTGIEADDFQTVFEFLDTGPRCENIKHYDSQNNKKPKSYPQNVKPGKRAKLLAVDQFFIYVSWLRNGFTTKMLPKSKVSSYLVTWTNLLYFSLGKIVIWPSNIQVLNTMPETFKTTYPSAQCIIDCT